MPAAPVGYTLSIAVAVFLLSVPDVVQCQSAKSRCRIQYDRETCYTFYSTLKNSLFQDPRNIYELQQAFYPMGRFTSKVLLNVQYSVRINDDAFSGENCPGVEKEGLAGSNVTDQLFFYIGWSSSEIFNIISALQLSQLQLQIFNEFYGLFVIPGSGIVLQNQFVWKIKNSTDDKVMLEKVNLIQIDLALGNETSNSTVADSRLCVPDKQVLMSVLQDITIMLKVWASTSSPTPDEINEDDLGFVTHPGLYDSQYTSSDHIHVTFIPFFAIMISAISFVLGISSITILGMLFPKAYSHMSNDRRQFKYYFFALAITLFVLDIMVIIVDFAKVDKSCRSLYFDFASGEERSGCGPVIGLKMTYFVASVIFSLVASILSSQKCRVLIEIRFINDKRCLRLIYILCCWSIIFFLSLVVWAIAPTLLMTIVYPHIYLPLTVVMLASIFWLSVMLTIPQMFFHNIRMNIKCIDTLLFMLPFVGLIILIFVIGLLTLLYVNSVVFGSDIGGPLGLALATIPSIALTFFSEFYRDWFLTRTTDSKTAIEASGMQYDDLNSIKVQETDTKIDCTSKEEVNNTNDVVISNNNTVAAAGSGDSAGIPNGSTHSETDTIKRVRRQRAMRGRRGTRIVSTGEPPGFLQKRLNDYIMGGHRSRVYTTPHIAFGRREHNNSNGRLEPIQQVE